MLSVICWKWAPNPGYRSKFGPAAVNTLRAMVARHYRAPHRFICVTDDPAGLDPRVQVVPLWDDLADLPSPHGRANPSCYRRLRMFRRDAGELFGERFVSLDLDCVITADLRPLWDRPEDVVFWGDTNKTTHYNGSMMLLTAGARPQVWDDFDPVASPRAARAAGQWGSDQAWISHCLGGGEAKWGVRDGVYSYRNHLLRQPQVLPAGARIVIFHGTTDPWDPGAQRLPWVRKHYVGEPVKPLDVESIHLAKRLALLSDGRTVPITQLLDGEGDETDNPAAATAFVAGAGKEWFSGATSDYQQVTAQ
jgi:hypothetical protein